MKGAAMPVPPRARPVGEDDLDPLPPTDGDAEGHDPEPPPIELEVDEAAENLLDDATGEADPVEPIEVAGDEGGWLDDAGAADDVDVGAHDFEPEDASLLRDVDEPGVGDEDFGLDDSSVGLDDAGEEGFDEDDDELREEDLPRMDADAEHEAEGDLARFWGGAEPEIVAPPWDDRAWERVAQVATVGTVRAIAVSDGTILVYAVDAWHLTLDEAYSVRVEAAREAPAPSTPDLVATGAGVYSIRGARLHRAEGDRWRAVEGIEGLTAITAADGGLLGAIHSKRDDRAWIVRIGDDENARIVAELGGEEEDTEPKVTCLAWDPARKIAWVGGAFGAIAFRQSRGRSSVAASKDEK
jgi:hypothetical protein